jgi:hypothetical protein
MEQRVGNEVRITFLSNWAKGYSDIGAKAATMWSFMLKNRWEGGLSL